MVDGDSADGQDSIESTDSVEVATWERDGTWYAKHLDSDTKVEGDSMLGAIEKLENDVEDLEVHRDDLTPAV